MYISLNWINDFVKTPDINIHDIANDFTMKTAEVEGVEQTNLHLTQIKVAEIKSLRKHPEADKLNLVTIDYGIGQSLEVVCGASNVREGLKIPYAPIGVTLPNGLTLEPKKIRGILSEGMLCSEVELGLGEAAEGLMELSADAPIGNSMADHLDKNFDTVIEVDNKSLTHRPDLWGIFGIAREFGAIYKSPLIDRFDTQWHSDLEAKFNNTPSPIKPVVDKNSSCLGFWGLSIDGVRVEESPLWIQERLIAVGLRPINSIVDISNYVMIELGMPLHIYDRERISGNTVEIKPLSENMEFKTLDEVDRKLVPGDTVICDSKQPLVLAGIMGGLDSGVSESTTKVFLEVANWNAPMVRKTSTRLGLRTDSSTRYEKSLDTHLTYRTLLRTLELILELNPDAKVIGKAEYDGESLKDFSPLQIELKPSMVNKHLGTDLSNERIKEILISLSFKVNETSDNEFSVIVPSFRSTKDIQGAHDLTEEIGRIIGYDSIENVPPEIQVKPIRLTPFKKIERQVQDFFSLYANSLEVMSYPLIGEKLLSKAKWDNLNEELELVNAITNDADRMRPTMVANFLEIASINTKNFSDFSFFEWGRIYEGDEKNFFKERNILGFCMYSKSKSCFTQVLDNAEKFLNFLGLKYQITDRDKSRHPCDLIPSSWTGIHPFECVDVVVRGKSQGAACSVHPKLMRNFKMKGNLSFFFIDLSDYTKSSPTKNHKYSALSKFPASQFDCSVVMKQDQPASLVLEARKKAKIKDLVDLKIVDIFKLNEQEKSVTLRFSFQDKNKTLSPEDIKSYEAKCMKVLEELGFPLKT